MINKKSIETSFVKQIVNEHFEKRINFIHIEINEVMKSKKGNTKRLWLLYNRTSTNTWNRFKDINLKKGMFVQIEMRKWEMERRSEREWRSQSKLTKNLSNK